MALYRIPPPLFLCFVPSSYRATRPSQHGESSTSTRNLVRKGRKNKIEEAQVAFGGHIAVGGNSSRAEMPAAESMLALLPFAVLMQTPTTFFFPLHFFCPCFTVRSSPSRDTSQETLCTSHPPHCSPEKCNMRNLFWFVTLVAMALCAAAIVSAEGDVRPRRPSDRSSEVVFRDSIVERLQDPDVLWSLASPSSSSPHRTVQIYRDGDNVAYFTLPCAPDVLVTYEEAKKRAAQAHRRRKRGLVIFSSRDDDTPMASFEYSVDAESDDGSVNTGLGETTGGTAVVFSGLPRDGKESKAEVQGRYLRGPTMDVLEFNFTSAESSALALVFPSAVQEGGTAGAISWRMVAKSSRLDEELQQRAAQATTWSHRWGYPVIGVAVLVAILRCVAWVQRRAARKAK